MHEIKLARFVSSYELLYNIQLPRCISGASGFAKLVGIVVDTTGKHLKSYLVDLPRTKWRLIFDEVTNDRFILWKRRENWAKQLVEGVSQVHSKGLVIGTLWIYRPIPVLIDSSDCLYFGRFKDNFITGYTLGCYYPPEFRHLRNIFRSTNEADCPNVTPKTKIFHPGMLLRFLAENLQRGLAQCA